MSVSGQRYFLIPAVAGLLSFIVCAGCGKKESSLENKASTNMSPSQQFSIPPQETKKSAPVEYVENLQRSAEKAHRVQEKANQLIEQQSQDMKEAFQGSDTK